MNEVQARVDEWMKLNGSYWQPLAILASLVEEVGELARILNHLHGPKKARNFCLKDLEGELGDILFHLASIANSSKIDLEKALEKTISKYNTRDKGRWNSQKSF